MQASRYLLTAQKPVSVLPLKGVVLKLCGILIPLFLLTLSVQAVELPLSKQVPATDDGGNYVLSWDHSPGWYWPTLDSLGPSRWIVEFAPPAELDVLDCRIASYGGTGDGVTISLIYRGQRTEIDTTLCGYLENGSHSVRHYAFRQIQPLPSMCSTITFSGLPLLLPTMTAVVPGIAQCRTMEPVLFRCMIAISASGPVYSLWMRIL